MSKGKFSKRILKHAIITGLNIVYFPHSEEIAEGAIVDWDREAGWDKPITLEHYFTKLPIFRASLPHYEPAIEYITTVEGKRYLTNIKIHKILGISIFTLFEADEMIPVTSFMITNRDLFI